ncbi:hypothetical protein DY000_02015714 [Brassica cretica]|uniref:Uncharacterized protein n=1 Tax=Brassica cretica TaxID=69181 RepID=A0ABQ7CVL3_BRACR|nr:hypothetical protein DY000_02015714 [Brassica cretica]
MTQINNNGETFLKFREVSAISGVATWYFRAVYVSLDCVADWVMRCYCRVSDVCCQCLEQRFPLSLWWPDLIFIRMVVVAVVACRFDSFSVNVSRVSIVGPESVTPVSEFCVDRVEVRRTRIRMWCGSSRGSSCRGYEVVGSWFLGRYRLTGVSSNDKSWCLEYGGGDSRVAS